MKITKPQTDREALVTQLPPMTPDTANELAMRMTKPAAAKNVLNILRNCTPERIELGAKIIIDQIHRRTTQTDHHDGETGETRNSDDGTWDERKGFSDLRTRVIELACTALEHSGFTQITKELEVIEPWIHLLDTMQIKPQLDDWPACRKHQEQWQHQIVNRNYDATTGRLLGAPKGRIKSWPNNGIADVITMKNIIICPITNQAELASECAAHIPHLYQTYLNRCTNNVAQMFNVTNTESGDTITLCALRFHKRKWKLTYPTSQFHDRATLKLLKDFAERYQRENVRPTKQPKPAPRQAFHCLICDPQDGQTTATPHNSPARCQTCWLNYHQMVQAEQPTGENQASRRAKSCAACRSEPAKVRAKTGRSETAREERICTTCDLISIDHRIFELHTNAQLFIVTCRNCETHLHGSSNTNLCNPCQDEERQTAQMMQIIVDDLHKILDTKDDGKAKQNRSIKLSVNSPRADMTTQREDAGNRRLTPALSIEVCREYVQEKRLVPELALRFNVSVDVIQTTLSGKAWKADTEGHRPKNLRPEPKRTPKPRGESPPKPKPVYITVSRLKSQYGWTESRIVKHLKTHDHEAPNPHYRSAAPMRLFLLDRVQEITAGNQQLQAELQKTMDRRQDLQSDRVERTAAKRAKLLKEAEQMEPVMYQLPTRNAQVLAKMAAQSRLDFLMEQRWYDYDDHRDYETHFAAVNMIRHEYTNYEWMLEDMPHSRDVETNVQIYHNIKRRVIEMIAREIPELSTACKNQLESIPTGAVIYERA